MLKALAGAMVTAIAHPYFIPISFPAVIAWFLFCKQILMQYEKSGMILYYLAPILALIGSILGFLGPEWRWSISMIYILLVFPLVLYVLLTSKQMQDYKK